MIGIGEHIDDFMSVNLKELEWLYKKAKEMQSIVEIGSCKGRSTYALCISGCPKVVAVDAFEIFPETLHSEFIKNVGHFENLKLYKMLSAEASLCIKDKSVDMIFIDGNHSYDEVIKDLENWTRKATKLICGHDYGDMPWSDVKSAVTEFFGKEFTQIEVFETIWAVNI